MKSSRVMKIFEQYVRKYDMNNVNIKAKYFHSLKVMEIAKELANGLGIFDEEEISVIELIGLFHENLTITLSLQFFSNLLHADFNFLPLYLIRIIYFL